MLTQSQTHHREKYIWVPKIMIDDWLHKRLTNLSIFSVFWWNKPEHHPIDAEEFSWSLSLVSLLQIFFFRLWDSGDFEDFRDFGDCGDFEDFAIFLKSFEILETINP